jgi:hypothetical protein
MIGLLVIFLARNSEISNISDFLWNWEWNIWWLRMKNLCDGPTIHVVVFEREFLTMAWLNNIFTWGISYQNLFLLIFYSCWKLKYLYWGYNPRKPEAVGLPGLPRSGKCWNKLLYTLTRLFTEYLLHIFKAHR